MHKLLLAPALLLALAACQQSRQQKQAADSTAQSASPSAPSAATWAKRFKGTLAGQPVTLLLQNAGAGEIRGWYVYDAHGEPIGLRPDYGENRTDDSIIVNEGYGDGVFRGALTPDGRFKGKWSNEKNTFDFDLAENNDSALIFSVVTYADSAQLLPGNLKSPSATGTAYTVWPTAGSGEATVGFLQRSLAPGLKAGELPVSLLKNGVDSFFANYKSSASGVDSASLGDGPSWSWSTQSGSVVAWNQWPLLAIENWSYDFTGGAHGNGGSNFSAWDLALQKKLTPADVFKPNYKPTVAAALGKAYRRKFKVPAHQSLEDAGLFVKQIEPNDNFFLTSHGVVFSYTPYEIAAYAAGQITLFVPWADVRAVVKDEYRR